MSPIDVVSRVAPRGLLLIAPREDRLVSWRQSVAMYEAAEEPKELYVVDGAAHGEARMLGGADYERRVLDFLERHMEAGSGRL
jgi:fermentation-respiration switch protein FrsA (DUF1100 family)